MVFNQTRSKAIKTCPLLFACNIVLMALLSSCGPSKNLRKEYVYFQAGMDTVQAESKETIIQSNDLIGIQVFSKTVNQEQAAIFNIPAAANNSAQGYLVNDAGNIEMPVIGTVKAAGLTIGQLQSSLSQQLTPFVKNASVVVRFLEFNINVLGEVRSPGTQKFTVDRVTIIDAISAAGDLTDFGKRDSVTVIREVDEKKIYYSVDLRNRELFKSPVYVLRPNDIVYVSPNESKLKTLSVDPEKQRKTGLVFAITSLLISITTLILTIVE